MAVSATSSTAAVAQNAYGLQFESLLKIILTQLTYQDPLKPMDNTEFVSQLAQFSQLQQTQSMNDQLTALLSAQAATQATSLLGKTVDISTPSGAISGTVQSVAFASGQPSIAIKLATGQTVSNLPIANISQVR
ncbi:flagellar hook assembly protein FlgD [Novosphingobium sp. B 225]|uniref:flagellar hook assembly protein FlgD n=1 Tax=Novosphingobium sp. B 225 TaxID=1961849 RepID=UPI000B4C10C1|nr:flagellar hook capping FlgD N-terminal domain-containing protein [Novosphingobium sp. B 225]